MPVAVSRVADKKVVGSGIPPHSTWAPATNPLPFSVRVKGPGATFAGLTLVQRRTVIRLAAILRLANAFDDGREHRIESVACEKKDGFLLIRAQGYNPRDGLAEKIAGARHLLETVYRQPVLVRPLQGRGSRAG